MGPIQTFDEFMGMLRRRGWLIVLLLGVGIAVSVSLALQRAHSYEATAVLQIENPVVLDGAGSIARESAARRLQQLQQRLMARDTLVDMIDEYGLFGDAPRMSLNEKVAALRDSTQVELVITRDGTVSALVITTRLGSPQEAAMIANEFAATVLEEGTRSRTGRLGATLEFFAAEERRLSSEITALEEQISTFKAENGALLPESLGPLRDELSRMRGNTLDLDRRVSSLERERAALVAEGQRVIAQRQIPALNDEIAGLEEERALIARRISEAEAALQRAPEIERTLNTMERRAEQLRIQYGATMQRRAEAELGQRLEMDQQSERFEILERAQEPEYPVGSSRRNLAAAGSIVSLGAAVGLAFLLELLNPVIRSGAQMQRTLNLRPVVAIPYVQTASERRRLHLFRLGGFVVIAMAGLIAAGVYLA